MVRLLGYHDAYASGVVHAIAGGTCLAVLINLGPRIGKFRAGRHAAQHPAAEPLAGLHRAVPDLYRLLGFLRRLQHPDLRRAGRRRRVLSATNIYLQPTTLSAITFNFIMALCGGLMAGYIVSKADPFWTFSAGLAGVIGTSAGNDLYHPIQAFIIAVVIVVHHLQAALLGGAALQDRRRRGGGRRARLYRLPRRGHRRLRALGLPVLAGRAARARRTRRAPSLPGRRSRPGGSSSAPSSCSSCSASSPATSSPGC